jgi:hypothetical protein
MSNSIQYLPTYRSGYTGPSERIGGSSPYHIDLKILSALPLQEKIRALDSLAQQYSSIGREIEFSNQAVSSQRWNPNASPEEKKALFEAATKAHATRPGWDPLDFYVPFKGKSRFDTGAVEGASIYIPGVPGGKIRRGAGGGYGYFSEAMDPSGRVVFRVGHGDINRPEQETEIAVAQQAAPQPGTTKSETKSAEELLLEKIDELMKPKIEVSSSYAGPSPETFRKAREEIDQTMMQLLLEKAAQKPEEKQAPQYVQNQGGAAAAALAQKGFATPKSLI